MPRLLLVLLLGSINVPIVAGLRASDAANPVRRVVTMLQMMQQKVVEEGKKEKDLFDKFMCQCAKGTGSLEKAIEAANTKMPQIESSLKEAKAEKDRLTGDVTQAKADRKDAKQTLAEARGLRKKEAASFAKESQESKANIKALGKAVVALKKGMSGGFLQTSAAQVLRHITATVDMSDSDRDLVSSFLSQDSSDGESYAPAGGEIVGILDQMKDSMEKELQEAKDEEAQAIVQFTAMEKAKEAQIGALTKQIEAKTARTGEVGVMIVDLQEDLDDTTKSLKEDTEMVANLKTKCAERKDSWTAEENSRAQEQIAIAETIKILNDDDALDTFKRTLPTAESFLQVQATRVHHDRRREAMRALKAAKGPHAAKMALIAFSLRQKQGNFDKVMKMIDDMVALLNKEQGDDDKKKAYCAKEMDEAEDQKKELETDISDISKAIEEGEDKVAALKEELAALSKGIMDLDKDVAEATAQRKSEHETFVETLAANNAAKELLGIAENRLNKFYNPKLYNPAVGPEKSENERIASNFGVSMAQTDDDDSAPAFVQVSEHVQQEAPKRKESSGVIAMINELVGTLDKQNQEMQVDEKKAQAGYEKTIEDSAEKRATDAKTISEKERVKADLEAKLHGYTKEKGSKRKELLGTVELIKDLHEECDWLMKNYKVRKDARASEMDSLRKAKAVLGGADYK